MDKIFEKVPEVKEQKQIFQQIEVKPKPSRKMKAVKTDPTCTLSKNGNSKSVSFDTGHPKTKTTNTVSD